MSDLSQIINLTIYDKTKQHVPVYWSYCGLGLIALIANCIIVFVYLSSAQLRSRFALFIGLAIAEGINGAGFLATGINRLILEEYFKGIFTYPITTRSDCAGTFENGLLVIGNQGPALLSLALGIERFCAIKFPAKYRIFKDRMFHSMLIVTAVICGISLGVAYYIGFVVEKDILASLPCTLSNAFGFTYTTYNYFFTAIGHFGGFVFNFIAFWTIQSFKKKGRMQVFAKEIDQIRLMHFISICSVIMVVIPNMFLYIVRFNFFAVDFVILGWLNCAFVSRSAFSLHLLGFRSKQFRQRFSELVGCCIFGTSPTTESTPIKSLSTPSRHSHSRIRTASVPIAT